MDEIENGRITSTMLGYEDHGILSFMLHLDFGGSGQGFGGIILDEAPRDEHGRRRPTLATGLAVARILEVVGVRTWEELPGQYVRVERRNGLLRRLGNILRDQWLDLDEFKALFPERG